MPSPWTWDAKTKRFRRPDGRFISFTEVLGLRDQFADAVKTGGDRLIAQLAGGEITIQEWVLTARQQVKETYMVQYMLGRGGRYAMTPADFGRVGAMVKQQYQRLQSFAEDMRQGRHTVGQAQARFQLYFESSSQAFERGKSEAYGMPALPAYPGDGSSECKANDRCTWKIEENEEAWLATWTLGKAEHCPTCLFRSDNWAPLTIAKV